MPSEKERISATGQVTDLFGHRFALATEDGKILADLGPRGPEQIALAVGDLVTVVGERKPSEVKVHTITRNGRSIALTHGKPEPHRKHDHDPKAEETALAAVRAAGYEPVGPVRYRPKHLEIDGRREGERIEFHVEFDGRVRKTKPAHRQP